MTEPTNPELKIFECLEYIKVTAKKYAKAKAEALYLTEFRKSQKAILMTLAEGNGVESAAKQERDAYASLKYTEHLKALRIAVEEAEAYRWKLIAAQAQIEVWRTLESSSRLERKII